MSAAPESDLRRTKSGEMSSDEALLCAQRLITIYRQRNAIGDANKDRLDAQFREVPAIVVDFMRKLPGGIEADEYRLELLNPGGTLPPRPKADMAEPAQPAPQAPPAQDATPQPQQTPAPHPPHPPHPQATPGTQPDPAQPGGSQPYAAWPGAQPGGAWPGMPPGAPPGYYPWPVPMMPPMMMPMMPGFGGWPMGPQPGAAAPGFYPMPNTAWTGPVRDLEIAAEGDSETAKAPTPEQLVEQQTEMMRQMQADLHKQIRAEARAELKEELSGLQAKIDGLQETLAARAMPPGETSASLGGMDDAARAALRAELKAQLETDLQVRIDALKSHIDAAIANMPAQAAPAHPPIDAAAIRADIAAELAAQFKAQGQMQMDMLQQEMALLREHMAMQARTYAEVLEAVRVDTARSGTVAAEPLSASTADDTDILANAPPPLDEPDPAPASGHADNPDDATPDSAAARALTAKLFATVEALYGFAQDDATLKHAHTVGTAQLGDAWRDVLAEQAPLAFDAAHQTAIRDKLAALSAYESATAAWREAQAIVAGGKDKIDVAAVQARLEELNTWLPYFGDPGKQLYTQVTELFIGARNG